MILLSKINLKPISLSLLAIVLNSCSNSSYPVDEFVGCYAANSKNRIELTSGKSIYYNGRNIGKFEIEPPVAGKHGFQIQTSISAENIAEDKIIFGNIPSFWAAQSKQYISVIVRSGYEIRFSYVTCGKQVDKTKGAYR